MLLELRSTSGAGEFFKLRRRSHHCCLETSYLLKLGTIWMEEKDNLIKEKDILKAYYLSKTDKSLEKILKNPGLQHLAENIFGNLNLKYLKVCRGINQSSKQILANPIFWKKKLEGSLSQKDKDFIKAIQPEEYPNMYKDIISILQWMLEKSPDQAYNGSTDVGKILAALTDNLGPDHVQLTKVNWILNVNWKKFQEIFCKIFPIDFVVVNHVL